MIKTDLHIHTVASVSDHSFDFSIETLISYVNTRKLDCIAVTNHNLFDVDQFYDIKSKLEIAIYPGIEIDLGRGHILLISNDDEIDDFNSRCKKISGKITSENDSISLKEFKEIFTDLSKYILIPHLDKTPEIEQFVINDLREFITSGEVSSVKKFIYQQKKSNSLTPVIFSDSRMKVNLNSFPIKQTYLATEDTSFNAIKYCLSDKTKVHMSHRNDHFQIFQNGQNISLGLNVVFGERSSGKTVFLDTIKNQVENVKYIKQFQLLERDEDASKRAFTEMLSADQDSVSKEYLSEFENVVGDVLEIDLKKNEDYFDNYLESLMKAAIEKETEDSFSKTTLFRESVFVIEKLDSLNSLINSVEELIENTEYRGLIDKHIEIEQLKKLAVELIESFRKKVESNSMMSWVNDILRSTKLGLESRSAATVIEEFDIGKYISEKDSINKFIEVVTLVRKPKRISSNVIQGFEMVADTSVFKGAIELNRKLGRQASFTPAFEMYDSPYEFLTELDKISLLPKTDIYKYFVNIEYKILNEHGLAVSGGERSEFNLLREIKNALHHNLLLIDEPESSFDNLFLKNSVNKLLKEISECIPVVVVTHNSTIGASIEPNYLIHTKRVIIDRVPYFKVYSGLPTDRELVTIDGETIRNYSSLIDSLEAGEEPYSRRSRTYETLKN